jgi:polyisoprenoid-binding protein YceI
MATWNIDPTHTTAGFAARHMMVTTVRGKFDKVSGVIDFDPANPTAASVNVTMDAASINTGVTDRDNHLRSGDFLDVATYPEVTFKSTSVKPTGENTAEVTGDLTIRGVTRPVVLKTEFLGTGKSPFGTTIAAFEASTSINREDFGLTWNVALEAGGVLVSKEIKLEIAAQAVLVTETVTA